MDPAFARPERQGSEIHMGHGFAKGQRLLHAAEYKSVFDNPAIRHSSKHFLLLARPNNLGQSRLGLVMSKKNVGCSVMRNRLKRLCREAFRLHAQDFATIDIVLLGRPGISRLDNPAIHDALVGLLDKLTTSAKPEAANCQRQ
jgi:ribonuclease P protein component